MEGIRGLKRLQLSSFLRFFDVFWNFCFEFRPIDENFKTSLQIFPQSACNFIHGQNVCSTRLHVSFDEIGANLKNFSHNFSPDENRRTFRLDICRVYSAYQSGRNVDARIILENILISVGMFNFQIIIKSVLLLLFFPSNYF